MNTTEHAHAAIISLTQYESGNYHGDMDAARRALLDTMRHIIAIAKQTPAAAVRPPCELVRPERACRYHRILGNFTHMLPLDGRTRDIHNHVALAWWECVALCEYHGWMPPAELAQSTALARRQPTTINVPPAPEQRERRFKVVGEREWWPGE